MYIESTSTVLKTKLNNANITQIDSNKLAVYRNEIKQTRQQRDNEMMLKKNLTEKILVTWKELKDIRIKQKFRNTDLKLIIKRKEVKRQKEEKQFDTDLKEELEEIMNEKQDEYNLELSVYEQKIKAYKLQKLRKVSLFFYILKQFNFLIQKINRKKQKNVKNKEKILKLQQILILKSLLK